ncbi:hypothetical protein REPUB_Repub14bG0141700 [Reevesia pubescens]
MSEMESLEIGEISVEDLKLYTDNFSQDNFIGNFQFGKAYRGKIGDRSVVVKIWMAPKLYRCKHGENEARMEEELLLHADPRIKSHPNLAKLIGYCRDSQLGVVYDLNPVDTLRTFILRDDFTWLQRIKVALELACLLKFLHTPCSQLLPYLVRNIDAAHFLLDQDYNLVLYDFGMFSGGVLPDRSKMGDQLVFGCFGYIDAYSMQVGHWYEDTDVFAFGIILVGLIAKRVFIVEDYAEEHSIRRGSPLVHRWAIKEYERRKSLYGEDKASLVHESLEEDSGFKSAEGVEVTKLAMQCLEYFDGRPTAEELVQCLSELDVLQHSSRPWVLTRCMIADVPSYSLSESEDRDCSQSKKKRRQ